MWRTKIFSARQNKSVLLENHAVELESFCSNLLPLCISVFKGLFVKQCSSEETHYLLRFVLIDA